MDDPGAKDLAERRKRFAQFVLILIGIVLAALFLPPVWAWLTILMLLAGWMVLAGYVICGLQVGFLIDERYKISLSRLQMVSWTTLILSAFLTAVFWNLRSGVDRPLDIAIPNELWLVMGISTASLVGSPMVRSTKTARSGATAASKKQVSLELKQLDPTRTAGIDSDGVMLRNESAKDARWADIFRGEELSNGAVLDLGKIQMFFFTFVLIVAYGAALVKMFAEGQPIHEFPVLDEGMIALLGISHAGYLVNKAVPRPATPPKKPAKK